MSPRKGARARRRRTGRSAPRTNQLADYVTETRAGAGAGSDPAALSGDAHRRQYENFLAALAGEETLRVDLETNRQAIAIITGAYESARTGRPVSLA